MQTQKEINLAKVVGVVKENKRKIGAFSVTITLLAIIYCILATPIYTAKTLINPPKLSDAGSGISQALNGFAALSAGGGFLNQKTDVDVAMAMLNTNSLKDMVITKFNLISYYKKKDIELTRRTLADNVKFIPDPKSGFLEIDVDDKDPKLATNIANYYTVALGQLISNVAYGRSKQKMQFFENQLSSVKNNLNLAQNKLKAFAIKNGIAAGIQTQVITGISTQLQAQLVVAQAQLQAMSLYATADNPDYQALQAQVSGLRKQLDSISGQSSATDQLPIPANLAPELTQQYSDLMRDLLMNEEILKIVAKQYEATKIDAYSELAPTSVQVIDPAQVPLYKSKPKRLMIILQTFLVSITISVLMIIWVNRKNFYK